MSGLIGQKFECRDQRKVFWRQGRIQQSKILQVLGFCLRKQEEAFGKFKTNQRIRIAFQKQNCDFTVIDKTTWGKIYFFYIPQTLLGIWCVLSPRDIIIASGIYSLGEELHKTQAQIYPLKIRNSVRERTLASGQGRTLLELLLL